MIPRIGKIGACRPFPDILPNTGMQRTRMWPHGLLLFRAAAIQLSSNLPLKLGRQTVPCPLGIGRSLEIAHMADRFVQSNVLQSMECEDLPSLAISVPVGWCFPLARLHRRPSFGQPESRMTVAAVRHEGQEFAIADRPLGDSKIAQ